MLATPVVLGRTLPGLLALVALALPAAAGDTILYAQDREDGTGSVHAWKILDGAGGLEPVPGSPFAGPPVSGACGGFCMTMASGRRGKQRFLFTAQNQGVLSWSVADDGSLALVAGSPFDDGLGVATYTGLGTVRQGQRLFLYVSGFALNQVLGFEVQEDGTLVATPGSPYAAGNGPNGLDTAGKLVVACNEIDGSLSSWVAQKDGSLVEAPGSPVSVPGITAYNVQLDDKGRSVWVADASADLYGFAINKQTGALTPLDGSPTDNALESGDAGTQPGQRLLISFSLGTAPNTPDIAVHSYSPKQGLTLRGRQLSGLDGVRAHAFDERQGLLAVVEANGPAGTSLRVFRVDRKTGAMLIVGATDHDFSEVNDLELIEL